MDATWDDIVLYLIFLLSILPIFVSIIICPFFPRLSKRQAKRWCCPSSLFCFFLSPSFLFPPLSFFIPTWSGLFFIHAIGRQTMEFLDEWTNNWSWSWWMSCITLRLTTLVGFRHGIKDSLQFVLSLEFKHLFDRPWWSSTTCTKSFWRWSCSWFSTWTEGMDATCLRLTFFVSFLTLSFLSYNSLFLFTLAYSCPILAQTLPSNSRLPHIGNRWRLHNSSITPRKFRSLWSSFFFSVFCRLV